MNSFKSISIDLSYIKNGLKLLLDERIENTLFVADDWEDQGEAKYQIKEGCLYEYEIVDEEFGDEYYFLKSDFIQPNIRRQKFGIIAPNIYVGTLSLDLYSSRSDSPVGKIKLEVQSVKADYRKEYRFMLESITKKCTDLIMQIDSPVNQNFETDFSKNPETLYQRFSFVKSLIDSLEFEEAIQKIVSNPTTKWDEEREEKDIQKIKKFNQKDIRQLVAKSNRFEINGDHFLNKSYGLTSIPSKIEGARKIESSDTAENRFVKHVLQEFLFFCENCELKFEKYSTAKFESSLLSSKISTLLNQSLFKRISRPTSLKLNSPVLQRKSGYREVLNAWLKFDLAAKLIWNGGENVYDAGKKDIATLYEYWLFFTLLDLLKDIFKIEPKSISQLIQLDKGHLSLNLKQGTAIAMKGVYKSPSRNLNIQFSYNRSFGGKKKYPDGGSYTTTLRPDYTLSIWPEEIIESKDAENKELITHIHFDAKYKVNNFYDLVKEIKTEEELNNDKVDERKGTFKNVDLLKMHAYKDAIRRTGGAYILYPGVGKNEPFRGFHELIPGLGAFVIKPNKDDKDKEHLKTFIRKVIANFIDRASQREYTAVKIYDIHKDEKDETIILNEPMPEYLDSAKKEKLVPNETQIIVGYYKSDDHLKWIKDRMKYNGRIGNVRGAMSITPEYIGAHYLVLHTKSKSNLEIFKIDQSEGFKPSVISSSDVLFNLNVPKYPDSRNPFYLVFSLLEKEKGFLDGEYDISILSGYSIEEDAFPFTCTLTDFLIRAKKS